MPGTGFTPEQDRIKMWMRGRIPDLDEECTRCGGPFSDPPGKACKVGYRYFHICGKRHGRGIEMCQLRVGECLLEESSEKMRRLQVKADAITIDARIVLKGLGKLHERRNGWELFPEFVLWTKRVDALAVRLYNSGPPLIAYEIKVERGDFLAEIRNPDKRLEAMEVAAAYYLAAPTGLIAPEEVPEGCGLVEVSLGPRGGAYPTVVVAAPERPVTTLPLQFVARMLWRMRS